MVYQQHRRILAKHNTLKLGGLGMASSIMLRYNSH